VSGGARARWGWYRLAEEHAAALVAGSGVGAGDLVLDLGAGDGCITRHLVGAGARVLAFELHAGRLAELRHRFAAVDAVKVVGADVTDLRLPSRPFHVVANPPFNGVGEVVARLTSRRSAMQRATLVVPLSVARRFEDRLPGAQGRWRGTIVARLPRSAFVPRPRIDCCVVRIERRPRRARP
jgi:23S rRNA (adenine-N6)-dimethyltransferase